MSNHSHEQSVPRGVLAAAAALITFSIAIAAISSPRTRSAAAEGGSPVSSVIELQFEDRKDGAIAVRDAASGRELSVVPPNSNGFMRPESLYLAFESRDRSWVASLFRTNHFDCTRSLHQSMLCQINIAHAT